MKLNNAVKGQTVNIVHPERGAWTQQLDQFYQLSVPVLPRSLPSSSTDLSATPAGHLEVLLHRASRHVRSSRKEKIDLKTVQLTAVHPCGCLMTLTWLLCSMSNTRGEKKIISAEMLLELLLCLRQLDPVRTDVSFGKKGWVFDRMLKGPRRVMT